MGIHDWRTLVTGLASVYKDAGFKRAGSRFQRLSASRELVQEVWYQKHSKNSGEFTANLEIRALGLEHPKVHWEKLHSKTISPHWSVRLGETITGRDAWWPLPPAGNEVAWSRLMAEHEGYARSRVIPLLDSLGDMESLIELWSSGVSPGLWEARRDFLLSEARRRGALEKP